MLVYAHIHTRRLMDLEDLDTLSCVAFTHQTNAPVLFSQPLTLFRRLAPTPADVLGNLDTVLYCIDTPDRREMTTLYFHNPTSEYVLRAYGRPLWLPTTRIYGFTTDAREASQ